MEKLRIYDNNKFAGTVIKDNDRYKYDSTGRECITPAFNFEKADIDHIFPSLKARVPDQAMPGVMDIVKRIGLKEYDVWEILKKTGGKRLTDKIELRFVAE